MLNHRAAEVRFSNDGIGVVILVGIRRHLAPGCRPSLDGQIRPNVGNAIRTESSHHDPDGVVIGVVLVA